MLNDAELKADKIANVKSKYFIIKLIFNILFFISIKNNFFERKLNQNGKNNKMMKNKENKLKNL